MLGSPLPCRPHCSDLLNIHILPVCAACPTSWQTRPPLCPGSQMGAHQRNVSSRVKASQWQPCPCLPACDSLASWALPKWWHTETDEFCYVLSKGRPLCKMDPFIEIKRCQGNISRRHFYNKRNFPVKKKRPQILRLC